MQILVGLSIYSQCIKLRIYLLLHMFNLMIIYVYNKDKNVHRFSLSAIRGELLEREGEKEREKEIVLGYYSWVTYYP